MLILIKKTKTPVKPEFLPCFQRENLLDFAAVFLRKYSLLFKAFCTLLFFTLLNLLLSILNYILLISINTFNPLKLY